MKALDNIHNLKNPLHRNSLHGAENVPQNAEQHERDVDDHRHPERHLVPQVLLEVQEHDQAHGQSCQRPGNVGHERHLRLLVRGQTPVDRVAEISTHCEEVHKVYLVSFF